MLLGNLRADERVGLQEFLRRLGAPVLAEAGSGLREKLPGLVVREPSEGVRKVLRIGGVPSARFWRDLETRPEVRVLSVSRGGFAGLGRGSEVIGGVVWELLEVESCGFSSQPESIELPGELRWFRFLSEQIPHGSLAFIGNSLPVREWNAAATFEDRGLRCYSNRGANGIDGALSTFFGLSEGEPESWAIVGDLTALYDLSAPWILGRLSPGKRRIVVINNGGGRIFSKLPALANLSDAERRAVENDHSFDLEHWAAMWGMSYVRVEREGDFHPVGRVYCGGDRGRREMKTIALHGMLGEASDWDFLGDAVQGVDLWRWDYGFDRIKIDADVVIGYSMGGRLALHCLDQAKAAVIVSAHTGLGEGRERRLQNDLRWAHKARTMGWGAFLAEWNAQPVFGRNNDAPDRSALESRREQIAAAFDRWSLGRQENLLPSLAGVEIPVLWINGARDEKFVGIGEAACEKLPRGEHLVLEDSGHRVPWEVPGEFVDVLEQFLTRVDSEGG